MGDLVPRKELVKQGVKGIGGVAGGIVLLILAGLSTTAGLIIGGILTLLGLFISTSKEDRTAGMVAAGAGVLTLISSLVPGLGAVASWLMRVGGIGLLITGGYSFIKFLVNLAKRR
jgi:hypothetical protein